MKKFSKILFLLLALVAIVTAFTVVALASEETTLSPVEKMSQTYNDAALGSTSFESNQAGYGYFGVATSEGSTDYYLEAYNCPVDGGSNNSYWGSFSYGTTSPKTPVTEYPHASISFDIMKPNDIYGDFSTQNYLKGPSGTSATGKSFSGPYLSTLLEYLPSESYEWAKFNIIFSYRSETVDGVKTGYVDYTVYINGKQVLQKNAGSITFTAEGTFNGFKESELHLTDFRLSAQSASDLSDQITAIDNAKIIVYPAQYSVEDIAKETYPADYEFPYGKTVAVITTIVDEAEVVKGYDSLEEAIAAANADDTIELRADVENKIVVNKAVSIDANIYDENDVTTGNFYSTKNLVAADGYAANLVGGIYTFDTADNAIKVVWDPDCNGEAECDCHLGMGHPNNASMLLLDGSELTYPAEIDSVENGVVSDFLGWSYTEGATVADDITTLDATKATDGVLNLYPVYANMVKYSLEVISSAGESSFYNDFKEAFTATSDKGTIKLHADVTTDAALTVNRNLTIDLNGFALRKCDVIKTYYTATDNGDGTYTYGTTKTSTSGSATNLFTIEYGGTVRRELNFITSRPGAEIYRVVVSRSVYVCGNEEVYAKNTKVESGEYGKSLIYYKGANNHVINVNGDISIYTTTFVYCTWGSNLLTSNVAPTINTDGATFYNISSAFFFRYDTGGYLNFTNTTFIGNGKTFFNDYAVFKGCYTTFTFDNCDIVNSSFSFSSDHDRLIINNSRFYSNSAYICDNAVLGEGTMILQENNLYNAAIESGCNAVKLTGNNTKTYDNLLATTTWTWDEETLEPIYNFEKKSYTATFKYQIVKDDNADSYLPDVMFSMIYTSKFEMLVYIPADLTDVTVTSVKNFTQKDNVLIEGREYLVFSKFVSTLYAGIDHGANVEFVKDGVTYVHSFRISALVYADIVLEKPLCEEEALAVANMVRFVKEARTTATGSKGNYPVISSVYDPLIGENGLYPLADFGTYTSDIENTNVEALSDYISSINFTITGGVASYRLTHKEVNPADVSNIHVYIGDTELALTKGQIKSGSTVTSTYLDVNASNLEKRKIYDVISEHITIKVVVDENTTLTATYSVLANIAALEAAGSDASLVKALYEFGVTAKAFREYYTEYFEKN